jgi:hypothetical protein
MKVSSIIAFINVRELNFLKYVFAQWFHRWKSTLHDDASTDTSTSIKAKAFNFVHASRSSLFKQDFEELFCLGILGISGGLALENLLER